MFQNKKSLSFVAVLVTIATLSTALPVLADTSAGNVQTKPNGVTHAYAWGRQRGPGMMGRMARPVLVGTVSGVSGTTLTVTGRQGFGTTATTASFTVDATNAQVTKDGAASTLSSIAVGDTVAIGGTINGTTVTATTIRDGKLRGAPGKDGKQQGEAGKPDGQKHAGTSTPFVGSGEPVIAGNISAINGSSLTVTTKNGVAYTVNAGNAKILQGQTSVLLSTITVGDTVIVQGTVSGTAVTASTIFEQKSAVAMTPSGVQAPHQSFFKRIGGFFGHLFGF